MRIKKVETGMVVPASLRNRQPFWQPILVQVVVLVKPGEGVLEQPGVDRRNKVAVTCLQEDGEGVGAKTREREHFAGIHWQLGTVREGGEFAGKNQTGGLRLSRQQNLRELVERKRVEGRQEYG